MGKRLNYFRAKVISYACILGFLVGLGMASQGNEAGVLLIIIAIIIGLLNKFVFSVRLGQLKIDTMENIRDR